MTEWRYLSIRATRRRSAPGKGLRQVVEINRQRPLRRVTWAGWVTVGGNVPVQARFPGHGLRLHGTGTGSCTDLDACIPNQCIDAGDGGALCFDHPAPETGYDCSCDAGFVFDGITCTDRFFADRFETVP